MSEVPHDEIPEPPITILTYATVMGMLVHLFGVLYNTWLHASPAELFEYKSLTLNEALCVSLVTAMPLVLAWPVHRLRPLAVGYFGLVNLLVVLGHFHVSVFATHMRLGVEEGKGTRWDLLWDSVMYEADTFRVLHLALVLIAIGALLARMPVAEPRPRVVDIGTLFAVAIIGIGTSRWLGVGVVPEVARHPLLALTDSQSLRAAPIDQPITRLEDLELAEPLPPPAPVEAASPEVLTDSGDAEQGDPDLVRWRQELDALPKNTVVFVVMESVGSVNIFEDGELRTDVVPWLAAHQAHAIRFDAVYNTFPATVRTHIPIMTGGHTITWGSVYETLGYPYVGASLTGSLQDMGYKVGVFSSSYLDGENMLRFYKRLPHDHLFTPDRPPAPGETWDEYQTSTWSIDERVVVDRALAWADEEENRSRKLALVFLTGSTHHPYEVPKDVTPREPIENTLQKYEHVVRFTDEVIQSLVSGLYARNRPPLLAVVGDHGQAFGKRHTGNFTHKHFLYEENVKNFMLLSHPNLSPGLVSRRAFIGDVMPTLVDALGGTTLPVPGRSMLRDPGEPRIFHFHKSAHPQQWGLVDGDLKYINEVVGGKPEIYDLATDPLERKNIAAKHPERVENYQKMAAAWYASTNEEYLKRLAGYKAKVESLSETDLMGYGPKRLAFGYGRGNGFRKHSDAFGPDHEITAFAWVLPWEKDKNVTYVWRGPGGEDVRQKMVWKPDWSTVWTFYDGPRPIPEGTWTVTIYAGARELISGSFDVRAATEDP